MSQLAEFKSAVDKVGDVFDEYKKVNDARLDAVEKGLPTSDFEEKLGKMEADVSKFSAVKSDVEIEMKLQKERIEELEAKQSQPGYTKIEKAENEHKTAFLDFLRSRGDESKGRELDAAYRKTLEAKEINIGTPSAGGFAVPEELRREIEDLEEKFSPVRSLVNVTSVSSSDYKALVNIRGTSAGWVGEQGPRAETDTPALREITPTNGELYAYPQSSEWALDDVFFNVEAWLAENVAQEFALMEGDAVIRGDGVNKPTGMLNTAPELDADAFPPTRAAAVYQYIAAASTSLDMDELINLIYATNSMYRSNGTFAMNSNTTGAVRRLKDSQGQYLWEPSQQMGQPDRLLGYPVATWEQLDEVSVSASTTFPVAFGDFRRAYLLTDRVGMRITRDNVTNVGFIRWYIRRREGGIVLNNDALKWVGVTTA